MLHRAAPLYTEDGGMQVNGALSFPLELSSCSTCRGTCPTPVACFQPEPERAAPARRFTPSPEFAGAVIGSLLGLAGALALAYHLIF